MITIALFHSALGLRPGVLEFAARLRAAGHGVHAIDSFDGETFDDLDEGMAKLGALGVPELIHRAQQAVDDLPADIVYAGFSMGCGAAEFLTATRPGARGALLMSNALDPRSFGIQHWPQRVPVQVHYAAHDPLVDHAQVDALADAVRAADADFEVHTYPGSGHLFADPDRAEYDRDAAELLLKRTLDFLGRL
ncbi:dienelactone hydrolase family protein [Actinoplanes sp. NPDC051513]|uniref:dienelactone hydrolase family protein n=1 Tax=Actinoplanes sp. NPDC051513 TaxID=3363908 RepID=UPI0037AEE18F